MSIKSGSHPCYQILWNDKRRAWERAGNRRFVARALDFNYPPQPGIARLDYTATIRGAEIRGQIVLRLFPLTGDDPLNGPGTVIGQFTFVGQRLTAD